MAEIMTVRMKYALNTAAILIILAGCVRESSDCAATDPTVVNLEVKFTINLEMEPYSAKANSDEQGSMTDRGRYILEIFEQGGSVPLTRFVATKQSILNGENGISAIFSLPAAKYTLATWVDYLDEADNFYDVTDLSAIRINSDYHGCNDLDNAFVGVAEIDLTPHAGQQNAQVVKMIPLECPFAKIRIVATDTEKFLTRMTAKGNNEGGDLSAFTVRFTYPGFLATSFNVFQNNPNDVSTGVTFTSYPALIGGSECLLGYDYVLVNGNESSVLLDLTVLDANDGINYGVSGISIPIARGKVTTVRGEFLTESYQPGVAIDPGYEGEINISLD